MFYLFQVFEWRGVNTWSVLGKTPTLNPLDAVVVAIACGASHSLALTQNGDVRQMINTLFVLKCFISLCLLMKIDGEKG